MMLESMAIPLDVKLKPMVLGPLSPMPLVSILVANYNYERFVGETIESVLRQTYQNFELIVCDDGSTDGSVTVIAEYAARDGRVRLLQQRNGGHGSALNRMVPASLGEVICLLDSDDLLLPQKVERVVELFGQQEDAGIVLHRVIRVDEARKPQGVWPLSAKLAQGWQGERLLDSGGVLSYLPPTSGLSFRREVLERVFPLPVAAPAGKCPDQVLMRLAPMITEIASLDEALAEYRVHASNTYTRSYMTLDTVTREIDIGERLWDVQHTFLMKESPEIAAQLLPVGQSKFFLLLRYVRAKLAGTIDEAQCYQTFIAGVSHESDSSHLWFWRSSRFMPTWLFSWALNVMMGQSGLKRFIARLRGLI